MRIIDFQNNGLGDVVLGCWIVNSAFKIGEEVFINPRNHLKVTELLEVPRHLVTTRSGGNWTKLQESGFTHELQEAHHNPKSRFDFWAESLDLKGLKPVRPDALVSNSLSAWGKQEWQKIEEIPGAPRVILFPEATRETRKWPLVYWLELAALLKKDYNVCVMTMDRKIAQMFDCYYFWGQPFDNLIGMLTNSDFIVSADSGAAHLASTLKIPSFTLFGPTIAGVVFGHEKYAHPIATTRIACTACNFSASMGYRPYCNMACQALYLLGPNDVTDKIYEILSKQSKCLKTKVKADFS